MSERRDWLQLPPELLPVITKKLPDLPDFARFRAVCKTWSSSPLCGCPPQLPWLLEWLGGESVAPILDREQRFYSLSSGEIGTIHVKESHCNIEYRGPCRGHLLLLHEPGEPGLLSLFNPLTKEEISLPPLDISFHWPIWMNTNGNSNEVMVVDRNLYEPDEEGTWAYYHPDNKEWITEEGMFNNCCYQNGLFFSTEECEVTEVFDVTSKNLLHSIPPPAVEMDLPDPQVSVSAYLVESAGEILRVSWFINWHKRKVEESVFIIHRLNLNGEKSSWVKVNGIGEQMIFLDELNGFTMSAEPFPGVEGNCIYFVHLWLKGPYRYDIKTGTVEALPCPFKQCSWFVPSLE